MKDAINSLLISAPVAIYIASLIAWGRGGRHGRLLAVAVTFSVLSNILLKHLSSAVLPSSVTDRPSGCGKSPDGNTLGCGIFPFEKAECGNHKGNGFPSGHVQHMVAVSVLLTYFSSDILTKLLSWAAALLVSAQRIASECHTIAQAVGGTVTGMVVGGTVIASNKNFF